MPPWFSLPADLGVFTRKRSGTLQRATTGHPFACSEASDVVAPTDALSNYSYLRASMGFNLAALMAG